MGFILIGFSQGGLIARLIYAVCPQMKELVKVLVTVGTPNLGTEYSKERGFTAFVNNVGKFFVNLTKRKNKFKSYDQYINEEGILTKFLLDLLNDD